MNYQKVHDSIIDRARLRASDPAMHQQHHIIPRHEDTTSTETVPLTLREHALVHRLRWKITGTLGNRLAWLMMTGIEIDEHREKAAVGGSIGGVRTRNNMSGIFSPDHDRSAETKRRHDAGLIPYYLKQSPDRARENGLKTSRSGKGIYSGDYDRSSASKKLWETGSMEGVRESNKKNASLGGAKSKALGTNFTSWDADKHKQVASLGGKVAGNTPMWTDGVSNKRSIECPGDGWKRGVTRLHHTTKKPVTYYFKDKNESVGTS